MLLAADRPGAPDVLALIGRHRSFALEHSPAEEVFALDVSGLLTDDISFWSARSDDGVLLGIAALRTMGPQDAEIKSMHTAAESRGQGVGRAMLGHLLGLARQQGVLRVWLETGTMEAFAPARALYASVGFVACPPFGDYPDSPNSTCMTLSLA